MAYDQNKITQWNVTSYNPVRPSSLTRTASRSSILRRAGRPPSTWWPYVPEPRCVREDETFRFETGQEKFKRRGVKAGVPRL